MIRLVQVAMIAALTVSVTAAAQNVAGANGSADQGAAASEKKASGRLLRGDIEAVDIEAKTLTVQVKKGGELVSVVIETDAKTQFTLEDSTATLVDLRKGMKVTVLPDVGIATKVTAKKAAKQPPKRTAGGDAKPVKEDSSHSSDAAKVGQPATGSKPTAPTDGAK